MKKTVTNLGLIVRKTKKHYFIMPPGEAVAKRYKHDIIIITPLKRYKHDIIIITPSKR